MALTIDVTRRERIGRSFRVEFTCTFDSSYPTGGEPLVARDLGVTAIRSVKERGDGAPSGYSYGYDRANEKLIVHRYDYDNTADGPTVQVADATNLASVTAKLEAWAD